MNKQVVWEVLDAMAKDQGYNLWLADWVSIEYMPAMPWFPPPSVEVLHENVIVTYYTSMLSYGRICAFADEHNTEYMFRLAFHLLEVTNIRDKAYTTFIRPGVCDDY